MQVYIQKITFSISKLCLISNTTNLSDTKATYRRVKIGVRRSTASFVRETGPVRLRTCVLEDNGGMFEFLGMSAEHDERQEQLESYDINQGNAQ